MDFCLQKCHFRHTQIFLKLLLSVQFQNLALGKIKEFRAQKAISETTYMRYFCHITIVKWSMINQKFIGKSIFFRYFYLRPVFHKIPFCKAQNLPTPEGKELQSPKRQFWKWYDQGNN